ncbi:MAG: hypothetical protein K1X47_06815 [Cyclobacteriaceae bacterium]|nr:hypothetical protein [Cyclobacteriaceae bacterium]
MRQRLLTLGVMITFHFGYLAWGGDQHAFLFEAEAEIILNSFSSPETLVHPAVLIPLCGLVLLLIALFQSQPSRWMLWTGWAGLAIFHLLLLAIGLLTFSGWILISVAPFLVCSVFYIKTLRATA